MAKKQTSYLGLPPETIVEVVMKKKMSLEAYNNLKKNGKTNGWNIQAYQDEVFSDGCGKKVDE